MCAFGKNLDFVTEWLDFPENRCNRKSIVDLHKRIFFQADFGCFFVIKMRFERKDKNNPDRCYITESNTGRDKMWVCGVKPGRCYLKYRSGYFRRKLRGRCLSVQVLLEVRGKQNKNARMEASQCWKLFEKNIPRAASCFWPHERICGRFRRCWSDVWGYEIDPVGSM